MIKDKDFQFLRYPAKNFLAFLKKYGLLKSGGTMTGDLSFSAGKGVTSTVNNQTGTTYTFQLADVGNNVVANNASASTYTLPQTSNIPIPVGTEINFLNEGVGTVTFQREGGDDIIGNTTCATGVSVILKKISTTSWQVFGGTATINMIGIQASFDISTSQTKEVCFIAPSTTTLLGIRQIVNGVIGTAGTFAIKKNGTTLSGLGSITPSTTASYTPATGTDSDNVLVRGDVITCVANGTLVGVTSLKIQLDLTQPL